MYSPGCRGEAVMKPSVLSTSQAARAWVRKKEGAQDVRCKAHFRNFHQVQRTEFFIREQNIS